ncbi:uncharacterized protein STEHIDRAFT_158755 [Stereum hirsutum FP-91666 SS1]|uniref:uncharacterized protein n=1 Tax=Stereum hirsutum (strain FP-91666) TaxID=721885 RepID=UPI000444A88E|nr:uncharacterized protein STEHIDRAFT_158755 [Stereum hirsutum FP-91666 SS1]EIM85062.1 hypothetical protein STEHIDRAFT_158755 [Stereum hirsutum FP-91666 SS1]
MLTNSGFTQSKLQIQVGDELEAPPWQELPRSDVDASSIAKVRRARLTGTWSSTPAAYSRVSSSRSRQMDLFHWGVEAKFREGGGRGGTMVLRTFKNNHLTLDELVTKQQLVPDGVYVKVLASLYENAESRLEVGG